MQNTDELKAQAVQEMCTSFREYLPVIQFYQRCALKVRMVNSLAYLLVDVLKFIKQPSFYEGIELDLRITSELEDVRCAMDEWAKGGKP